MPKPSPLQRFAAELTGTALLLATIVGSGIMAEQLAGGNVAIALLGNTLPTGAMLVVLITMLGPVSGGHFNPAVTMVMAIRNEIELPEACNYVLAQIIGAVLGVLVAHAMFDQPLLQLSQKVRLGPGQWLAEFVATFGLLLTILMTRRVRPEAVALTVGLYIIAAYWFTASTSFANPAVTVARTLTDTFSGIRWTGAPAFIIAQLLGAFAGAALARWLGGEAKRD